MKTNTSGLLLEAFNHFFEKPRGKKNNYTANKDLIENACYRYRVMPLQGRIIYWDTVPQLWKQIHEIFQKTKA